MQALILLIGPQLISSNGFFLLTKPDGLLVVVVLKFSNPSVRNYYAIIVLLYSFLHEKAIVP